MDPIHQPVTSNLTFPSALRFFQDLDKYSHYLARFRHPVQGTGEQHLRQTFFPNFDVRELDNGFELHGELPGVRKEDVRIEFNGPKTLEISGFIESCYTYPPSDEHKDALATHNGNGPSETTKVESKLQEEVKAEGSSDLSKNPSDKTGQSGSVKYWASERSLGEFHRSFTFPYRVQQDSTTATLNSGVLTVHIPKMPNVGSTRRVVQIS